MAKSRNASPEPQAPVVESADEAVAKLKELGIDEDVVTKIIEDLGVASIDDLVKLNEADLVLAGMKPVPARNLLAQLAPAVSAAESAMATAAALDVLPAVPDDASWLEALKAGGVLKVDPSTVISTIRAALADRVGLYDVPKLLVAAMEQHAEESEEQVSQEFFELRDQLTRRNYADLFAAIKGLDGNYVTESRKQQLLNRVDESMWPSIFAFNAVLKGWQEAWLQGAANPMLLLGAFVSGGSGLAMPPGMLQPPDTGVLRDQADDVNNAVNKAFRGVGVPIAAALAYDATQIRKSLENPRLPALVGVANRELMLKKLGVAVSSTYPRLETNLTRYVLGILQLKDQPAGNEELQYLGALFMLGSQIPWDQLSGRGSKFSGIGGRDQL